MPQADPFAKIRRLVFRLFTEGLAPFGFSPFGATIYFIRDRGPVRDALFIQKMRSNTLTIAYGVSIPPKDGPWSPGLLRARWLNKHEFFNVKSEEHARRSVARALRAFQREALPWFERFASVADIYNPPKLKTTPDTGRK